MANRKEEVYKPKPMTEGKEDLTIRIALGKCDIEFAGRLYLTKINHTAFA